MRYCVSVNKDNQINYHLPDYKLFGQPQPLVWTINNPWTAIHYGVSYFSSVLWRRILYFISKNLSTCRSGGRGYFRIIHLVLEHLVRSNIFRGTGAGPPGLDGKETIEVASAADVWWWIRVWLQLQGSRQLLEIQKSLNGESIVEFNMYQGWEKNYYLKIKEEEMPVFSNQS